VDPAQEEPPVALPASESEFEAEVGEEAVVEGLIVATSVEDSSLPDVE
jgi:hypothetical protein